MYFCLSNFRGFALNCIHLSRNPFTGCLKATHCIAHWAIPHWYCACFVSWPPRQSWAFKQRLALASDETASSPDGQWSFATKGRGWVNPHPCPAAIDAEMKRTQVRRRRRCRKAMLVNGQESWESERGYWEITYK